MGVTIALRTPAPASSRSGSMTTYEAVAESHRVRVVVEDRPCVDAMGGAPFPQTVTGTVDGATMRGCDVP